jgi:hypothetical protein
VGFLGLWILNRDTNRTRARVCFAFYLAAAFWKAAATAFVSAFGLAVVQGFTGEPPTSEEIAATMLTLAGGVSLNTLIGLGAIFAAVKFHIRVWVHPRIQIPCFDSEPETACESESTRAQDLRQFGFNHAVFVVATAITLPVVALGCGTLAGLLTGEAADQVSPVTMMIGAGILIGGTVALIPFYGWLSSRIVAGNPQECWPAGDFEV